MKTNLSKRDFLDVTFNLATEKYFNLWKANHIPLYINIFSNHPPTIIKQLHKRINNRISCSSYNKEGLDKIESVYEAALKYSGHFSLMFFNNRSSQNARRNRNKGYLVQITICELLQQKGPSSFAFPTTFRCFQLSLTVFQKFDTKISY